MNNGAVDGNVHEAECGYSFMEISVGLWKSITRRDREREMQDTKAEGRYNGI